jgi:hypothetical protein
MRFEEPTPEAVAVLKSLSAGPRALEDSPWLLMLADWLVKGSPAKIQITQQGQRLLGQYLAAESH